MPAGIFELPATLALEPNKKARETMTEPLSIETILAEFKEGDKVWVLKDTEVGKYVVIPHPRYPGRATIHFFLNPAQAEHVLTEIRKVNAKLRNRKIAVEEVKLLPAVRSIAADKTPGNADSYVVHPYNEVWEYLEGRESN